MEIIVASLGMLGVLLGVSLGWWLGRGERNRERKVGALADGFGASAYLTAEAMEKTSTDEQIKARSALMRFKILFHDNADVQGNLRHMIATGKTGQYLPEAYKAAAKEVDIDPSIFDDTAFGLGDQR